MKLLYVVVDVAGQVDTWAVMVDLAELQVVVAPADEKKSRVNPRGVIPVDPQGAQLDLAVVGMNFELVHGVT